MKKTITTIIANFNLIELKKKYDELHEVGAPRLFIEGIKSMMADAKAGKITVKGMARKHQIGDAEVNHVYTAQTVAYDYALPHRGDEMPTTVLMLVTDNGVYFWDFFTNQIGATQDELSIKPVESGWVSWVVTDEADEASGYYDIEYSPKGTTATTKVTIFATNEFSAKSSFVAMFGGWAELKSIIVVTKSAAVKRGLNF